MTHDSVNHPSHYTSDPSGVECIQVTRHRTFNIGNAIKYLWRAGLKSEPGQSEKAKQVEDLQKAVWYIKDEIDRLRGFKDAAQVGAAAAVARRDEAVRTVYNGEPLIGYGDNFTSFEPAPAEERDCS